MENENREDFNHLKPWLKQLIKETGLATYQVANRLGVSRAIVYAWMSDKYRPDPDTLLHIAEVFAGLIPGRKTSTLFAEGARLYTPRAEGRQKGFRPAATGLSVRR